MKSTPLAAAFLLFIALCASATFWGLQLFQKQERPVAAPPPAAPAEVPVEAATTLFGGRPAAAVAATNYQLRGVIAAGPDGVAILSADGQPPMAVSVNKEVAPGVTVKEVHRRYVLLNEGGVVKRVDLPDNAPSEGGNGAQPVPGAMMAPPSMPAPVSGNNLPPLGGVQHAPVPQPLPPPQPQGQPAEQPQQPQNVAPSPIPGGGHPGLLRQ